jgi:hypothetical protein
MFMRRPASISFSALRRHDGIPLEPVELAYRARPVLMTSIATMPGLVLISLSLLQTVCIFFEVGWRGFRSGLAPSGTEPALEG